MTEFKLLDALWTLKGGALQTEKRAGQLLMAIGEMAPIRPARYELNRRGRWREYDGRRLIVDLLTQRTQLMTIVEEQSLGDGGSTVVIATGKQGEPVQAALRWKHGWPLSPKQRQQIEEAVRAAFDALSLSSFVLRVVERADGDSGDAIAVPILEIIDEPPQDFQPLWRDP